MTGKLDYVPTHFALQCSSLNAEVAWGQTRRRKSQECLPGHAEQICVEYSSSVALATYKPNHFAIAQSSAARIQSGRTINVSFAGFHISRFRRRNLVARFRCGESDGTVTCRCSDAGAITSPSIGGGRGREAGEELPGPIEICGVRSVRSAHDHESNSR